MIETNHMERDQALALWPDVEPFVERALEHDDYQTITAQDIGRQLGTGFARLLVTVNGNDILGVSVVQMYNLDTGRVLHICTTSGVEMETWLDSFMDKCDEVACENDCVAIRMSGRPGWTRKLRKYGYRTHNVQMTKVIENGTVHRPGDIRSQRNSGRQGIAGAAIAADERVVHKPAANAVPSKPVRASR